MSSGVSFQRGTRPRTGSRPDLEALADRLAEFDLRVSEVKTRTYQVEARTAAYILLQSEGPRLERPTFATAPAKSRLAVSRVSS